MDENQIERIDLDKVDWRGSREFFESLGEALHKLDDKDERYDFTWVGKRKAIIEAGAPINKTFRPNLEDSKNWHTTENLFIEGDNLDALKLLQESYLGKVKMIYIDPPYNTGKDFVYHDNFKISVEQYDENTEYKDESGNIQFKKNEKTNGRYHSDWLSMMYPRLKLARNLLSKDGVIFISIDDNEQANLKKLCDEIYGEDNFINNFLWLTGKGKKDTWSRTTEQYILAYARQKETMPQWIDTQLAQGTFSNPDNDNRGEWFSGSISFDEKRSNKERDTYFTIKSPSGIEWTRQWQVDTPQEMYDLLDDNRIYFGPGPEYSNVPRKKIFPTDENEIIPSNLLDSCGTTKSAQNEVDSLMGARVFDNPKPLTLIEKLLSVCGVSSGDIVLDFFSGSATTAHAAMQLSSDNIKIKWILVQLPENLDEALKVADSLTKKTLQNAIALCDKLGKPHLLTELSKERIRRAGELVGSNNTDIGFRTLVVGDTNYKEVYKSAGEYEQSTLLDAVDNVKEDRSELDLLFGILTQTAIELNRPLETREIAGATTFLYDYSGEASGLVACFAESISEDAIKEIATLKPHTAVFRDSSFPDSQAKVNLAEHFRTISPNTKVKVI